jgi:hypothetical protein
MLCRPPPVPLADGKFPDTAYEGSLYDNLDAAKPI